MLHKQSKAKSNAMFSSKPGIKCKDICHTKIFMFNLQIMSKEKLQIAASEVHKNKTQQAFMTLLLFAVLLFQRAFLLLFAQIFL